MVARDYPSQLAVVHPTTFSSSPSSITGRTASQPQAVCSSIVGKVTQFSVIGPARGRAEQHGELYLLHDAFAVGDEISLGEVFQEQFLRHHLLVVDAVEVAADGYRGVPQVPPPGLPGHVLLFNALHPDRGASRTPLVAFSRCPGPRDPQGADDPSAHWSFTMERTATDPWSSIRTVK